MDDADIASVRLEISEAAGVAEVQRRAAAIPKGEPGDCDRCGEPNPRLVNGVCSRCRDKFKLP